ncbi:uncharacterized protein FFNC_15524 [Fusarium fujikuroi]|nr:uncharacterized protein FFNC_15524 [Fusarium fujikuroi]
MPFELVARPSSEKVYRKELKRFVCFWLRLFRLLPSTYQKVIGHRLKKHQFKALRELWLDDIWKSAEHVDVNPAANKDGGHDGDEGEYEDEDDDDDEDEFPDDDEIQDDNEVEDDEGYNEIKMKVRKGRQEDHPQDPTLDILLRFCHSAVTEDYDGGVASSTMLAYFSAVRGLTTLEGDEYLKPHRFTPTLAKLIYCSRLIFLEAVLSRTSMEDLRIRRVTGCCEGSMRPAGSISVMGKDHGTRNTKAARAYLEAHDDHLKGLMVLCNLDGGQFARISELLTLECFNTASTERGIGLWGAKMCSISRHHKARLATNNEFYPLFSHPVSRLIFQYLVYIRPVTISILRKFFHIEHTYARLFSSFSQIGLKSTPWTVSTFTKQLRRHCGAATERHVHDAAIRFNRFDDTTGTAGPEVAYAWQSGHRPMQRHTTYGLDGAYPDHLQPALLRAYDRVSASWHAFLWGYDKSGEPRSIPVEAEHAELNYESTRHDFTIHRKRRFISDSEETPSNSKRPRSGLGLLFPGSTLSDEVEPDSEESLALRAEEEATASCPPPARRLTAIILDIDSIIPIPANRTTIPAQPDTNGTIGFHSPEQERTEFDGTADIWALGVFLRAFLSESGGWFVVVKRRGAGIYASRVYSSIQNS